MPSPGITTEVAPPELEGITREKATVPPDPSRSVKVPPVVGTPTTKPLIRAGPANTAAFVCAAAIAVDFTSYCIPIINLLRC
jgi:hypothetical protein